MARYVYTLNLCGYHQQAFTTFEKAMEALEHIAANSSMFSNIELVLIDKSDPERADVKYYSPSDRMLWPLFKQIINKELNIQISYDSEYGGNSGVPFLDKVMIQ